MKAPEKIETSRLVLCHPLPGDIEAIFSGYASDPDVTRFVDWPRHQNLEDTKSFFEYSQAQWKQWPAGPFLIHHKTDGKLPGSTGLALKKKSLRLAGGSKSTAKQFSRFKARLTESVLLPTPSL